MKVLQITTLLILVVFSVIKNAKAECLIQLPRCNNPSLLTYKKVSQWDNYDGADTNKTRCLARANDFHSWCNLKPKEFVTAAFYAKSKKVAEATVRGATRCQIASGICPADSWVNNFSFNEYWSDADKNPKTCLKRAKEYHDWCGGKVTTTYYQYQEILGHAEVGGISKKSLYNLTYKNSYGYDSNLAKLDLYYSDFYRAKGIMVYVHGGGWISGDKKDMPEFQKISNYFLDKGYAVASINYRLAMNNLSPGTTYVDQASDIATAMKYLKNISNQYNFNGNKFVLFGHSAGAHLVSLVNSDPSYIYSVGLNDNNIKGVISSDVHNYNIPWALEHMLGSAFENNIPLMKNLFGNSLNEQLQASPEYYIGKMNHAPTLFISTASDGHGNSYKGMTNTAQTNFQKKLQAKGYIAVNTHYQDRDHLNVLIDIGELQDKVTQELESFLYLLD